MSKSPLILVPLGIYVAIVQRAWRWGSLATITGAAWFYLAVYVVLPHFNPAGASPYLGYYAYLGGNPLEMGSTILTQPGVLFERLELATLARYLASFLAPTAFLSALSPHILLLSITSLTINILSDNPLMHIPNTFQYASPIVPFAVIASISGVRSLASTIGGSSPGRQKTIALALCFLMLAATSVYHRLYGFSPLSQSFVLKTVTEHHRIGERLVRLIPDDAALSTDFSTNPHVSQRTHLYIFPRLEDADYVFLDVTGPSIPLTAREVHDTVMSLLESGEFGVLAADDGLLLLKRGLRDAKEIPDQFYSFARAKEIPSTVRVFTGWEGGPEELALDYRFTKHAFERYKMPVITLYWLIPPDRQLEFSLKLLARRPSGEVLWQGFYQAPAAIWYPPENWRSGEVVRIEAPPLSIARPWSEVPYVPGGLNLEVEASEDKAWTQSLLDIRFRLGSLLVLQPIESIELQPEEGEDTNEA